MMTVISSVNLIMSSQHRRWLTLRETLCLQGFPTDVKYTHNRPTSSFAMRDWLEKQGRQCEAWPSRRAACHQAGNSMHVAISGLTLLFAFSQVQFDESMLEIQEFQRKRTLVPTIVGQPLSKKARL